jgi:MHS family proline/betaine transporter-like MFS transporter
MADHKSLRAIVIAGMAGNVMEWYDFALFGYFAPIIAKLFFPSDNHVVSLINTFGVFAAGFLMRPIGAALFGHLGDTRGRKHALAWSVLLMALPTFCMGLLPTYAHIGVAAPMLLTLLRLFQGLSVGGEYTGSITFLVESAPSHRRGYVGSWIPCSACVGILLGSGVAALVTSDLSQDDLYAWGWRVPFVIGIVVGGMGLYLRSRLPESPEFERLRAAGSAAASPVLTALRSCRREIVTAVGLNWLNGASFYTLFVYLTTYLAGILHFPLGSALTINTISMAFLAVMTPLMGMAAGRIGRRRVMWSGALGMALLSYPLFRLLAHDTFAYILVGQLSFGFLVAVYFAPLPAALVDLFPPQYRFSGLSIGYNVALALFGGTAPLLATFLIHETGNNLAPSFYLVLCAAVALLFIARLPLRSLEYTPPELATAPVTADRLPSVPL